jgi:hypothetical protein
VVAGKASFSWSLLSAEAFAQKLPPLLLAGSALLALVFAFTPLSMKGRGLAAGLLGFACLQTLPVLQFAQTVGDAFSVQLLVGTLTGLLATLTLIPGLLLRGHYREALLPRILTTIGVLCVLAPVLIPVGGSLPLVGLLKASFSAPVQISTLVTFVYVVLAVLALLVWLPPSTGAGAGILAWLFILQPLLLTWSAAFADGFDFGVIKAGLATIFYLPLAAVGWLTLSGHGIAAFLGKGLERP